MKTALGAFPLVSVVALTLTGAALAGCQSAPTSSFSSVSPSESTSVTPSESSSVSPSESASPSETPGRTPSAPPPQRRPLGQADGAVPSGTTVLDDIPAVANLDSDLLTALRQAAQAAADTGVTFRVNSGWRSPAYQENLLHKAIATYGSQEEAARWVATAQTSPHVSGAAIDLGPSSATTWLSRNGAAYGLCQIYRNEPWHYELRPQAVTQGCPAMYADPTEDPRMGR